MKRVFALVVALFLVFTGVARADYPTYKNYVNDYTGTLSQQTITQLDKELFNLQKQNTDQVAVAIISTTGNQSIEDYSISLAQKWGVGQKGKDNGVLFLVAIQDHHLRIEVGRGLEGQLTDVQAQDIIGNTVVPDFKMGDYNKGVVDGTNAIVSSLGGHVDSSGGTVRDMGAGNSNNSGGGLVILFIIIAVVILLIIGALASNRDDGKDDDDSGFLGGALTGGVVGSAIGSALSGGSGDDSDDDDDSGGYSGGTSSFGGGGDDSGSSFGGFDGGSFSGGGASGSW